MRKILVIASVLAAAIVIPTADSQSVQYPEPPQTLVGYVSRSDIYIVGYPDGASNFDAVVNLTFPQSPQDDGTFQYNVWETDPNGATLVLSGGTILDVPDRPGWKYNNVQVSSQDSGYYQFRVTANNTAQQESNHTCTLTINLRINGSLHQCGTTPFVPGGISGVVTNATKPGILGTIRFAWTESLNDTDGNWTYNLYASLSNRGSETSVLDPYDFVFSLDAPHNGTQRSLEVSPAGLGLYQVWFKITAYDNLTRWESARSCFFSLDISKKYDSGYCGDIDDPAPGIPQFDGAVTVPQYPLVNLTQLTDALGINLTATAYILGFGSVAGLVMLGWLVGGIPLAVSLGVIGLSGAAAMLLIDSYFIVLTFLGALALIIFSPSRSEE